MGRIKVTKLFIAALLFSIFAGWGIAQTTADAGLGMLAGLGIFVVLNSLLGKSSK